MTARALPLRPLLAAILISAPGLRASAQGNAAATTTSPVPAPLLDGAATVTLDSATIAASSARTLAELLAGRVAGINVTWTTGAPGFDPEVNARGAASLFGTGRPALYVDGLLVRDDRHLLGPSLDRQRPSHSWSLPTAEIAEVRVLPGPAAGTLIPFGSPRGAVLVRTKGAALGAAWSARTFFETTTQAAPSFPTRVTTTGSLSGGGTTNFCTRADVATSYCTAGASMSHHPFGGEEPLHGGTSIRAGLSAAGSVGAGGRELAAVRAGLVFDQSPTFADNNAFERIDLSLGATSREWRGLSARAQLRYARSAGDYAAWGENGLMSLGELAIQPDDPSFIFFQRDADSLTGRATPYTADRGSGTLAVRWQARPWLEAWTDLAFERTGRNSDRTVHLYDALQPGANVIGSDRRTFFMRSGSSAMNVGVRARRTVAPGLRVTGELGGQLANMDMFERAHRRLVTGGASVDTEILDFDVRSRAVLAALRVDLGSNAWFGGGFRKEATELLGRTYGDDPFNTLQFGWTLSQERWFPATPGLARLHLRGAYGESGDHEPALGTFDALFGAAGMLSSVPARLQRTLEREAGADLGLLGDRLQLRFTAFDRATRDGYLRFPIPPSSGLTNLHFISWNSRGQEWSLATPRRAAGPVEVEGTFSWSSAVTRITHMEAPAFSTTLVGGSRARFERDQQFGALYAYGYTYADANDDGVIDATEITLLPESVRGSTQPTHLLAATLAVHWGARVSAGLTLDGKSGHVRADLSERLACQYLVCEDLYRADASLAEQARAVVSGYSSAFSGPVHEGDFIRARDLWVRVALKPEWFRAGAASLTLAVRNAATWTKYPGTDPEVGSFVYATVQRGDYLVPGLARQFSLRLDVTP